MLWWRNNDFGIIHFKIFFRYLGHKDGVWDVCVAKQGNPLVATASADHTAKVFFGLFVGFVWLVDLVGIFGLAWSVCLLCFALVGLIYKVWLGWLVRLVLLVCLVCWFGLLVWFVGLVGLVDMHAGGCPPYRPHP